MLSRAAQASCGDSDLSEKFGKDATSAPGAWANAIYLVVSQACPAGLSFKLSRVTHSALQLAVAERYTTEWAEDQFTKEINPNVLFDREVRKLTWVVAGDRPTERSKTNGSQNTSKKKLDCHAHSLRTPIGRFGSIGPFRLEYAPCCLKHICRETANINSRPYSRKGGSLVMKGVVTLEHDQEIYTGLGLLRLEAKSDQSALGSSLHRCITREPLSAAPLDPVHCS